MIPEFTDKYKLMVRHGALQREYGLIDDGTCILIDGEVKVIGSDLFNLSDHAARCAAPVISIAAMERGQMDVMHCQQQC